ncbi:MAG: hypothetical protein WAN36_02700 [Calditrichia bacterium]
MTLFLLIQSLLDVIHKLVAAVGWENLLTHLAQVNFSLILARPLWEMDRSLQPVPVRIDLPAGAVTNRNPYLREGVYHETL